MQNLPALAPITRLSPRVIRILGGNPGKFQLQGTNTYLVGTGASRLLIDTGEGKEVWKESLGKVLAEEGCGVAEVLLTHWHPDHVGGVGQVREGGGAGFGFGGGAGSGAGSGSGAGVGAGGADAGRKPHVWKFPGGKWDGEYTEFEAGKVWDVEGARVRAAWTPGHTDDHVCFVLEEEGALFMGDNVLGHGTAVFEDLAVYLRSLGRMEEIFDGLLLRPGEARAGRGYPGHGEVVEDGRGKVVEYLEHRRQREREILGVLEEEEEEGSKGGLGSMEIVRVVYKAYPEALWAPAEHGVQLVLKKLEGEGRVEEAEGGKWRVARRGGEGEENGNGAAL